MRKGKRGRFKMQTNAVTTMTAKRKMLLARAGVQQLPKITQMVFGVGGVNEGDGVIKPEENQNRLNAEIYRKDIDGYEIISDTQVQYRCTLGESELAGEKISEIALADEDGDLVAIKNFMEKGKDADWELTFKINDTM